MKVWGNWENWETYLIWHPRLVKSLITGAVVLSILISTWLHLGLGSEDHLYDKVEALAGDQEQSSSWRIETEGTGGESRGSLGRMSGVNTMWSWEDPAGETLYLQWSLTTEKGKTKLVLADGEGNLTTLAECAAGEQAEGSVTLSGLEGPVFLKLAAMKGAGPAWSITADQGQWEEWTQAKAPEPSPNPA